MKVSVNINLYSSEFIPPSTDINECATNNGGCEQICTNTDGFFQCSCVPGYSLATNGLDCDGQCQFSVNSHHLFFFIYRYQ